MATMAAGTHDTSYIGLLALAETFRTSNPPRIRQCIQCLQSVFQFQPSPAIQARTHLQLGKLLHSYTKNTDMARSHLEKAVSLIIVSLLYLLWFDGLNNVSSLSFLDFVSKMLIALSLNLFDYIFFQVVQAQSVSFIVVREPVY